MPSGTKTIIPKNGPLTLQTRRDREVLTIHTGEPDSIQKMLIGVSELRKGSIRLNPC